MKKHLLQKMLKQQALILQMLLTHLLSITAQIPIPLITVYGFPVSPFSSVTQSKAHPIGSTVLSLMVS